MYNLKQILNLVCKHWRFSPPSHIHPARSPKTTFLYWWRRRPEKTAEEVKWKRKPGSDRKSGRSLVLNSLDVWWLKTSKVWRATSVFTGTLTFCTVATVFKHRRVDFNKRTKIISHPFWQEEVFSATRREEAVLADQPLKNRKTVFARHTSGAPLILLCSTEKQIQLHF